MIVSFKDDGTSDIFNGKNTRASRQACPVNLLKVATRKLDQISQAVQLNDLRAPPANHLEKLKGDREGQYSIRINDQYRVCFAWTDAGATNVEIADYH
ncbi:MAG: type II toxin-antitoxin system RelE/ParE family toxin [Streptosporangiaceae bacterium]|jgi:proteic killer suppression protein